MTPQEGFDGAAFDVKLLCHFWSGGRELRVELGDH